MSKEKREYTKVESICLVCVILSIVLNVLLVSIFFLKYQYDIKDLKEEVVSLEEKIYQVKEESKENVSSQSEEAVTQSNKVTESAQQQDLVAVVSEVEFDLRTAPIGVVEDSSAIDMSNMSQYFHAYEIDDELFNRINGVSYKDGCDLRDSLRYLRVLHYGFDKQIHVGEIIVNVKLVDDFLDIFQRLFENKYEIERMQLIDDYGADDDESIQYNNTSAFNYRVVTGGTTLSNHAAGCAIDINPQQNPYVDYSSGSARWHHDNASEYIDRTSGAAHMIDYNDLCYQLFIEHGFTWGGDWSPIRDYQHFEKIV